MNLVKVAGILGVTIFLTAGMLTYCSPCQSCVRAASENPTIKTPEVVCLRMLRTKGG